jgi:hypothetical protein
MSASNAEKEANTELEVVERNVPSPVSANVATALAAWYDDCLTNRDNVAVLYISGHGIQNSKEGSIVLLQDFGDPADSRIQLLRRAIDIGSVREGMSRGDVARRQFYFIDSCRIRPNLFRNYYTVGAGVTIDVIAEGTADVSAVHFGASSGTSALGDPGKGTLFNLALLECLRGEAYTSTPDGWAVTQASLIATLPTRVEELAARYDSEQKTTSGGEFIDTVFHMVTGEPSVTLTVALEPKMAAPSASAELYDDEAEVIVFDDAPFNPELVKNVPAGSYLLKVTIKPETGGLRNRDVPLVAEPPRVRKVVSVST